MRVPQLILEWTLWGAPQSPSAEIQATSSPTAVTAYTASAQFPSALFEHYCYGASPTRQPQPKIYDEMLDYTFPLELTDPTTIPEASEDPIYFPAPIGRYSNGSAIADYARAQVIQILASNDNNCTKCKSVLQIGKYIAQRVPQMVPALLVELCERTNYLPNSSCRESYEAENFGAVWTQVLAIGNMTGSDGQYICHDLSSEWCPYSHTLASNTTEYFGPKPKNLTIPKASGERVKVLHLSDMHLDPRFATGQEANCTASFCCRYPRKREASTQITVPATTYGNFRCDSPYYLVVAALSSIAPLTGTTFNYSNSSSTDHFAWSIYTGDLVAHDPQNQLSRNFTLYAEYSTSHMMKSYIAGGPIFPALGNHDTSPNSIDAPHSLPGLLGQQQSWNYHHVASLWQHNGWISAKAATQARMHYGGYSINHPKYPKLRIITINTDFWYRDNYLNYINTTNPDNSQTLKFLAQELQDAETNGERVWIVGHVPTGWDGTAQMTNPTDLFYQIVNRYSPHVIAAVFFGHSHEDQFMLYYANNGTVRDAAHAQTVGWIGPSLTPLNNLNSGYRMYEVDTGDFSVYNAYTYFSNVSTYDSINTNISGAVFQFEYSARDAYPIKWPADAPLNATYWHQVTELMEANRTLVSLHNSFQGKSSIRSGNCTSSACAAAKICYMRSGSVALGSQCPQGFGSVQKAFTGEDF